MLVLLIIVLVLVWTKQRHAQQPLPTSSAGLTGGWHGPGQTAQLGGQNIDGNQFDNGTTRPVLSSQWSGYDPGVGNIVFATQGGEDGQNPAQGVSNISTTGITTLPRFKMIGSGDPKLPAQVPVQVDSLNNVVRR
jgi:hypothetical protein